MAASVFVSYSHESEEHKAWVLQLATRLRHNGIASDVLKRDGVRIALGVANATEVEILPLADALAHGKVDVEVLYLRTDWKDPVVQQRLQIVKKWEILVPDHVPCDLIVRVM